jgi:hypothetical protein
MASLFIDAQITVAADAPLNPPTHPLTHSPTHALNNFKLIVLNDRMTVINSK